MSKQSKAKNKQNFTTNSQCCEHCKYFQFELKYGLHDTTFKVKLRCGLGEFAVKLRSSCDEFDWGTRD